MGNETNTKPNIEDMNRNLNELTVRVDKIEKKKMKLAEKITVFLAIIALGFTLIESVRNRRIESRDNVAGTQQSIAQATVEARATFAEGLSIIAATQAFGGIRPELYATYFVGNSADLLSTTDDQRLRRANLSAGIFPTIIVDKAIKLGSGNRNNKFLFLVIKNARQGQAENLTIKRLEWVPKDPNIEPISITDIKVKPPISSSYMLAILIDSSRTFDASDEEQLILSSHLSFVCVSFSYQDINGNDYDVASPTCLGNPSNEILVGFPGGIAVTPIQPDPVDIPPP